MPYVPSIAALVLLRGTGMLARDRRRPQLATIAAALAIFGVLLWTVLIFFG